MAKVTCLLVKAGSGLGLGEIRCVKGMYRLKLVSSEKNSHSLPSSLTGRHTHTHTHLTHTPHSIPDGELIERIIEEDDLTEGVVVGYIAQLLSALECIHNMDIAHLDIKVAQHYHL